MTAFELQTAMLLAAFGAYASVVVTLTLWNARKDRRGLSRLNEPRPAGHVGHERRSQSLVGQVFGGHR